MTSLRSILKANGILTSEQQARYATYDTANPGCSPEHPIIIDEPDNYVHMEYELLELLLRPSPYRFVDYELEQQRLIHQNGRALDMLRVRVFTHPLPKKGADGRWELPEPVFLGTEEYWFDISVGYEKMKRRFEEG